MDAASNNGVDEIREIKNHVTLLPTVSKYKVYIIDEVHMLTTGAFNALLKTLEEPPKHVIFILATTEPHKIPLTIISRCQSFEFKPIPKNIIKEILNYICKKEKIKIDDKSLDLIAIDSNGGLRDAISMLDQLNAYSNGNIQFENVLLLNGRVSDDDLLEIINNIYDCNLNDVFKIIDKIDNDGKNFVYISEDMIKILRNELLNYQLNNSSKLIKKITKEKILDIILLINRSINDMKNSNDKRIFFDILILKIYEIINNNNKQTNVLLKNEISTGNKDDITKKIPVDKKENNIDFSLYDDLMNIRLNNILATASKKDLVDYKEKLNSIDMEIINLDQLRIANILNDFDIKAASSSGIVLTTSSDNLIHDIYNELINVDKYITDILKRDIKVCVILIDEWNKKREVYIKKIKNKEKIEILEEKEILDKIINKFSNKSNEFDDLLEIGGE